MPNYVQGPPYPRGLWKGDRGYSWGALTPTAIAASPGGLSRAANGTVTCTTTAPHKAVPGEIATIVGSVSVGGTRFDGNYFIQAAAFGSSALTLIPVDDVILHQAIDTGGGGNVSLIQMEQPAPVVAGKAFGLGQVLAIPNAPLAFVVGGLFDGNPAGFEIDVQGSDVDVTAMYQQIAVITTADTNDLGFHVLVNDRPNFVRAVLRLRTNPVNFAVWFGG